MKENIQNTYTQLQEILQGDNFDKQGEFAKALIFKNLYEYAKFITDFLKNKQDAVGMLSPTLLQLIENVRQDLAELEADAQKMQTKIQEFEHLKNTYDEQLNKQNNLDTHIQSYKAQIEEKRKENEENTRNLDNLKRAYQSLVDKLEGIKRSFEPIETAHKTNKAIFEAHFMENTSIWGSIDNPEHTQQHIQQLIQNVQKQLKDFDTALKDTVKKKDGWEISKLNT